MSIVITFGSLFLVARWEALRPQRRREFPALRRRLGNLGIWLFNVVLAALVFVPPDHVRPAWRLAAPLRFALGFCVLDLWSYLTHRAQHAVPWLWRLRDR